MILKRKIYERLLEWKQQSNGASALLINGARRVGKSTLCRSFGEQEYRSMIFIDFSLVGDDVQSMFLHDRGNLDLFFAKIQAYYGVVLYERDTLFVFDEVQLFPVARQFIKHLVADGRYDYIETGSLLGIRQNIRDILLPSEEEQIEMHPMDFEEFLWAMGDEATVAYLETCFEELKPLGQALHRKVMNDFRQYMIVGGMPQAVVSFLEGKNFEKADIAKRRIIELYRRDIARFADGYEKRVTSIFDSIPGQLSKKVKRYNLSAISKNARMRNYEDSFQWLDEAMIVNPCYNSATPQVGLALSREHNTFKLYMSDTGLLITLSFWDNALIDNELQRAILLDRLSINEGMIMENIVAQMLRAKGHKLHFFMRTDSNDRSNMMEIDFLITRKNKVCPIEVKSANYRSKVSLKRFQNKYKRYLGQSYVLYPKDVMVKDDVVHLPLYMAMFL